MCTWTRALPPPPSSCAPGFKNQFISHDKVQEAGEINITLLSAETGESHSWTGSWREEENTSLELPPYLCISREEEAIRGAPEPPDLLTGPGKGLFLSLFRSQQLPLAHAIGCWVLLTEAEHSWNFMMGIRGTEGGSSLVLFLCNRHTLLKVERNVHQVQATLQFLGDDFPLSRNSPATVAFL